MLNLLSSKILQERMCVLMLLMDLCTNSYELQKHSISINIVTRSSIDNDTHETDQNGIIILYQVIELFHIRIEHTTISEEVDGNKSISDRHQLAFVDRI